jgi:hypothetical protein
MSVEDVHSSSNEAISGAKLSPISIANNLRQTQIGVACSAQNIITNRFDILVSKRVMGILNECNVLWVAVVSQ